MWRNSMLYLNFYQIYSLLGFKCPVCSKSVASNEMEVHFIMCLSKPRLSYNGKCSLQDQSDLHLLVAHAHIYIRTVAAEIKPHTNLSFSKTLLKDTDVI